MTQPARIGKYEIIDELGRGGFAVVYKARDTSLDRVVALKVLHAHVAQNLIFIQRFEQEARTAAQFDHPNIITIYEVGEEAGQHYIAMNHLAGQGLDGRLAAAGGSLPLTQVVTIVDQLADALDYIHQHRAIHRDVKPANVIMSDEEGVTLLDFGIARAADRTKLTTVGAMMGTPQYMSPEQAEGQRIDHRSDVYALGVMAYQMCTGKAPFDDVSPLVVLRFHADKAPPLPQELNPDLPPQVAQVLLKALAKQPDERYQRAGDFAQALREAVEAPEQSQQQEAQLTELYTQLQSAISSEEWATAETCCQEILALNPDYRDVPDLLSYACRVQAEQEERLAQLYEQAKIYLRQGDLKAAWENFDTIERLADADYRDMRDLRKQAEAGMKQAQAERERQTRLAGLYERLQAADAGEEWAEVLALAGQIQELTKEDTYKDISSLKKKARRKLRRQQQSIPTWVWPVGGAVVLGLAISIALLAFDGGATPPSTITKTPSSTPGTTPTSSVPSVTPSRSPTAMPPVIMPTSTLVPVATETEEATRVQSTSPVNTQLSVNTPVLKIPTQGAPDQRNPITFQWQGELNTGQRYQVIARHIRSGETRVSASLSNLSWTVDLPAEKYGEWRWKVQVVQGEDVLAESKEGIFWFNPIDGGDGRRDSPLPTPEK